MMLTLTCPPNEDIGLYQLIEEFAHVYLPVRKVRASSYYPCHIIAAHLGVSESGLNRLVVTSDRLHGILLPTGALFIHPDGMQKYLASWGKKLLRESKAHFN